MKDLKIRLIRNRKELEEVFKIREIVFIKGQNVPRVLEMDSFDRSASHVIVFKNNRTIGCARIRFTGNKAKLERIAILKRYRGKGLGKKLVDYLIKYCKKRGVGTIILHSQYYLKDFYKSCGFKARGNPFIEAKIKHIEMYMLLT